MTNETKKIGTSLRILGEKKASMTFVIEITRKPLSNNMPGARNLQQPKKSYH